MDLRSVFTLNNGLEIPAVGLGTFQGDQGNSKVKEAVLQALKLGYRHIDGANAYGNEKEIGEAIKESELPREEIFVTSKLQVSCCLLCKLRSDICSLARRHGTNPQTLNRLLKGL